MIPNQVPFTFAEQMKRCSFDDLTNYAGIDFSAMENACY